VFDEQDETIERIAAALRPLPSVDDSAKARVLVAVAAERERDRRPATWSRRRQVGWMTGAGLAAAAALSAFLLRGGVAARGTPVPRPRLSVSESAPNAGAILASRAPDASANRLVQFVFRAPTARRVSLVGDFTGWDPHLAAMTRDAASGLWNVTLALPPGRHVYAFLVDDSLWVRDPRAPAAPDADFGRPGSVLLVGRP
jgi:hypothetical protein